MINLETLEEGEESPNYVHWLHLTCQYNKFHWNAHWKPIASGYFYNKNNDQKIRGEAIIMVW